jgi:hypothetical protein
VFDAMLRNLSAILDKTQAYAAEKSLDLSGLLQARLHPEMFPFIRQIQAASDAAKGATARLSGSEPPRFPDDEQTIDEIRARITKTLDYIRSVPAAKFDGSESRTITLNLGSGQTELNGQTYFLRFALPNFFFHVTTAYGILRHNGIPLGKRDFLGNVA